MNTIIVNPPKSLNLRVCGGKEFSIEEIRMVPTPEPTTRMTKKRNGEVGREVISWLPISHASLIDTFKEQMEAAKPKLTIEKEYLTLARDGQRFFGLFQVSGVSRANSDRIGTVVGLRNSIDKSFPAAICAGDAPFVCTNLIFSNEIKLGRKHTAFIMQDLPQLISRALGMLGTHWANQDARIATYRSHLLTDAEAHDLIIRAHRVGAIPKTLIADTADQWHNPEHDEFAERNGYSLYNAFTNVLRGNIAALNARSDALHGVLDIAFGLNATVVDVEAE